MTVRSRDARAQLQAAPRPPAPAGARRQGVVTPIVGLRVLFIHGPNANLSGLAGKPNPRRVTFDQICERCRRAAEGSAVALDFRQGHSEGDLVDAIQQAIGTMDGLIIDGGSLASTSIAVLDALQSFPGPIVEVQTDNVHRRDPSRPGASYLSRAATGIIGGLGVDGCELAVLAMRRLLDRPKTKT